MSLLDVRARSHVRVVLRVSSSQLRAVRTAGCLQKSLIKHVRTGHAEEDHRREAHQGQGCAVCHWQEERGGHEEEGRWHFRAQGPFAGVGIAVDLRGVNQTWEGPKPMFAAKLLKIHFA